MKRAMNKWKATILIGYLYGGLLALGIRSPLAATNTNQIARTSLNGHQQFYTNWLVKYMAVRRVIETNQTQILRHGMLMSQIPQVYPRTRADQSEVKTKEFAAVESAHNALNQSNERVRAQFRGIVNQRLAYELRFPAAIQYGPRIPKWAEMPGFKGP